MLVLLDLVGAVVCVRVGVVLLTVEGLFCGVLVTLPLLLLFGCVLTAGLVVLVPGLCVFVLVAVFVLLVTVRLMLSLVGPSFLFTGLLFTLLPSERLVGVLGLLYLCPHHN